MKRLPTLPSVLALLCVFLLLSGCEAMLEKEYVSIEPHKEQYYADLYSDALTAGNYTGLRSAILSFIESGTDYGVVRVYSYDGTMSSDLANVVYDVCHNDPLGAYAVEYMTYDYSNIISYYEIYFYITFRVAPKELNSIINCSDIDSAENELEDALLQHKYNTALRISNYQDLDLEALLHRLYLAHPELGISEPTYTWTLYPETGVQRILELRISYPYDLLIMLSRAEDLEEKADEIVSMLSAYSNERLRLRMMYRWIQDHVDYMGEDSRLFRSSYNVLYNGYGGSQGIAMAVQLLCNQLDIPCFTAEGRYRESSWFWNILYYDDAWHHFDAAAGLLQEVRQMPDLYDVDMTDYQWDAEAYPVCVAVESIDQPETAEPPG